MISKSEEDRGGNNSESSNSEWWRCELDGNQGLGNEYIIRKITSELNYAYSAKKFPFVISQKEVSEQVSLNLQWT